jgi:hypothetical protein
VECEFDDSITQNVTHYLWTSIATIFTHEMIHRPFLTGFANRRPARSVKDSPHSMTTQYRVTTIGSHLVMIIVCSYCADKLSGAPTKVHPSDASVTTRLFVERNDSIVITMPSLKIRLSAGSKYPGM